MTTAEKIVSGDIRALARAAASELTLLVLDGTSPEPFAGLEQEAVARASDSQRAREAATATQASRARGTFLGNAALSAIGSYQASDEAVDGRRPVPVRYIPLANTLREYAMSPVGAALPIVGAASVAAIPADGHMIGSALR